MKANLKLKSGKEIIKTLEEEKSRLEGLQQKLMDSMTEIERESIEIDEQIDRIAEAINYLMNCI